MQRIIVGFLVLLFTFPCLSISAQQKQKKASPRVQDQTQAQNSSKASTLKGKTVNINKATAADLVKNVPLITPALAQEIVRYRQENGDFQTLEELLQIEGFNRDLLRRIKPFLLLEGIGGKDCTC
jgi:competence protein ComEA